MVFHSYVVPHWIDDSNVALQCNENNSIGGVGQKSPEGEPGEPYATYELVVDAVT